MPPKRKPNKSAGRPRPAAAVTEPAQSTEVAAAVPTAETVPQPPPPPPNSSENPLFLPGYSDSDSDDDDNGNGSNNGSVEIISPPLVPPPPPTVDPLPPPQLPQPPPRNEDDDTSGGEDDATDEDPVVQTYDIQITTPQLRDLYIFQYPVRHREQPYTKARNACPIEARFKPKSGLVEVDIPVNVQVNYDEEKGRVWGDVMRKAEKEAGKAQGGGGGRGGRGGSAVGVGGKKRKVLRGEGDDDDDEEEEEEDLMYMDLAAAVKAGRILNRQTLGSKIQPDGTKYMAGVFKNDKLYLTPITSTLQLRPQFNHIDTQIELERAANKALHPVKQEARAIQLSVKNTEDPSSQLSSSMKAVRMAEEENWTKLHWVDQDTDDAWRVYEDVCLTGEEAEEGEGEGEEGKVRDELLKCVTTKKEYIEWLSAGKPIVKKEGGGK